MKNLLALLLFIALVFGGGSFIGINTAPGAWFAGLEKPFFNPPSWVFAPVWSILYIAIAIAGWRVWKDASRLLLGIWILQLALNFLWSPVFFTLQRPDLALIVILILFLAILTFIRLCWRQDRIAAGLFIPYAAWVGFASALNAAIFYLNSGL